MSMARELLRNLGYVINLEKNELHPREQITHQ